ncbi:MAG: hypothetical protein WD696_14315 [Bryobacteraceae bacterium]
MYRWFFLFLIVSASRTAIMFPLSIGRTLFPALYAWIWLISSPLMWALYVLVVFELYGLVLKNHPGLRTMGRWVLHASLSLAVVVSAIAIASAWNTKDVKQRAVFLYLTLERGIDLCLALLLLLILAFLAWFPVPLAKNIVSHSFIFSAYFLSHTVALLVRNTGGESLTRMISTILLVVAAACQFAWLFLLSREGEERIVTTGYERPREQERVLVAQLSAMNESLVRAVRK